MTKLITCPWCNASNRVPQERLQDNPVCGKCHQPLFTGKPVELDATSFAVFVEKNQTPVVVDFWAPWCGPCLQMAPDLEKATVNLEPDTRVTKLNTEEHPAVASKFNIRGIPTLILFANGKELTRLSGAVPASDIVRWVETTVSAGA